MKMQARRRQPNDFHASKLHRPAGVQTLNARRMHRMIGYIPSPKHGTIGIGPLELHAYGLMLAIGVLVAAKIADLRWRRAGHANSKVIAELAVPVVVCGVIGAR